jgi:hypothetical protein
MKTVAQLEAEYAAAQAKADAIRARLAKAQAKADGDPAPETGLDMLWAAAPAMARTRSSKFKCRKAWLRIPPAARPRIPSMLDALKAWSRCHEWQKDDGQFVPALDRWITERRWEDTPATTTPDASARYRCPVPPPPPPVAHEDMPSPEWLKDTFDDFRKKLK